MHVLALPIMMSYVDSGAFTFKDRLRESVWSNLQFYGVSGAIGLFVVGYIALTRNYFGADLVAFLMAAANFWGLFLVVIFMGFGLVSIPRKLWQRGDLTHELAKIESRAMAYKDRAYDSELELSDVVKEVMLVSSRVDQTDSLRHCVDQILECCPKTDGRINAHNVVLSSRVPMDITQAYLATLHNKIKQAVLKEERSRWRWNSSAWRAFFLQDALASRQNPNRQIESNLLPWSRWGMLSRSGFWWWYTVFRPLAYRILSVGAAILSVAILWSELTFNLTNSNLSIVHLLLRSLGLSYFAIEVTSIVTIAYMCLCAYSSVMKLKIFNIYSLETHHHTNERSLLFCGAYLCRLMFPLCYNFLNMAGSNNDTDDAATEFAKFMGQIDLVPVLGEQSNRAIPVLIMIPATLAFFNIHGRVIDYFSINRIGAAGANAGDDDNTELGPLSLPHEEGRSLIIEARRAAERQQGIDSQNARRYSPSGFGQPNTINFRGHISSASASADIFDYGTRNAREWHLGRPSLEHLQDEQPSTQFDSHVSPVSGTAAAGYNGPLSPFSGDMLNGSSSGVGSTRISISNEDDGDGGDSDASDAESSAYANGTQPTGMAARIGRWLPKKTYPPRLPKNRSKQSLAPNIMSPNTPLRPNNASKLRPSSRQSSRHNYGSDDGIAPGFRSLSSEGRAAGTRIVKDYGSQSRQDGERYLYQPQSARLMSKQRVLVQSPSSPGRSLNPWSDAGGDIRPQVRRHALSDSSARDPRELPHSYKS
ncbi:hypothetical protein GGI12_004773 [Dipsacomyces acuminosporus]|nr:hypothetical protein GGI12_004773 [Dipsacomyces acuminosporus]